jgi:D-glycero-D-manno-heptose 1,7-bisphosphate phosphatase
MQRAGSAASQEPVGRAAAFLDRDGTIIHERHYLRDPADVELLPGALDALRRLSDAGFLLVLATNQSGIARGLLSETDFRAVQDRVEALLAAGGVRFSAVRHCPHHPEISGPCNCRKPLPGMYLDAAAELGVDTNSSLFVGDRLRDVLPAQDLGGRAFLVRTGYGAGDEAQAPAWVTVVDDLGAVARHVAGSR